jgi:2-iminobutanoate/2-iminopropanoate deaminase
MKKAATIASKTGTLRMIAAAKLPAPGGHYAHATGWGDLIFVSGQLAPRPDGSHTSGESFDVQARQAIANMLAIVEAGGGTKGSILRCTVYLVGVDHWAAFNAIYAEIFGDHRPARSVVPVPQLHHGYLIEIEAIAGRVRPGPDR